MSAGGESKQSGETQPENSPDVVRPAGNHDGIANGKEKDLGEKSLLNKQKKCNFQNQ